MNKLSTVPNEIIMNKIYFIRDQKVMLDRDIARLYGVETKVLKQSVKRNISRFPDDFMFEMNKAELENWRSQFVTSKSDSMGLRYSPFCFTEQGVAMLSSILKSERAIKMNIEIMRAFTRFRRILTENTDLRLAIEKLERKSDNHAKNIEVLFSYMDELGDKPDDKKLANSEKLKLRKLIGYKTPKKKKH